MSEIFSGGEQSDINTGGSQNLDDYLPERAEWKPGQPKEELAQVAAQVTLARVDKWEDLWAPSLESGQEKFKQQTRELWRELVTHGVVTINKETDQPTLLNFTDPDGKCAIGLLGLAGLKINNISYVKPGEKIKGKINLDTSDRYGVMIEDGGKTLYVDHHTDEQGLDTSTTQLVYEMMDSLGMFDQLNDSQKRTLEKMSAFVTQIDNLTYPEMEKYWQNSSRTILGLNRFMSFGNLRKFFAHIGKEPHENLTDGELRYLELKPALPKKEMTSQEKRATKLPDRSEQQQKVIAATTETINQAEQREAGGVLESEKYGKLLVLLNKNLAGGFWAARAHGFDGMIYWVPKNQSFFISTLKPLNQQYSQSDQNWQDKFSLPQGRKVRERMWIKPIHDQESLNLTLVEILLKLAGPKVEISGDILAQIKKEQFKSE